MKGMSSTPPLHSYTAALTPEQAVTLRAVLDEDGYDFETKPYTLYAARKAKLNVVVYEKGPKAVIQGRGIEDFITFVLEPRVLQQAGFGYEEEMEPERYAPHFGVDESGKGDFFGPLVIAGCYVDRGIARHFRSLGIQDSKNIGSDKRIRDLAEEIRRTAGATQSVVAIGPERYNALFEKIGNLNRLLAWGHARVIENLLVARPECPQAVSDQFANPKVLQKSLLAQGRNIDLVQRTKAESDYAVAAASILAREKFIDWMERTGKQYGATFPRGASALVKARAVELVRSHGNDVLPKIAKTHFKTAEEVRRLAEMR